tara:strand:+ start:35 stop:346 length:312 start_codon:yes stop_codon:yes gene_type:complete
MKVRTVTGARFINTSIAAGTLATATVLESNDYRKSFVVTNMQTSKLYIKLGADCAADSFHFVLPPCGAQDDGTGGSLSVDGYVGKVTALGTSPGGRYTIVEFV